MKRLIALLIAILTLLFGGVKPADEPQDTQEPVTAGFEFRDGQDEDVFESCPETAAPGFESQEIETESMPELFTEKEKPDATAEAEADQPEDSTPSKSETTDDTTEPPVEPTDEPIPDIPSSQLTEEESTAEEQTEPMPEPTGQSEPQAIPSTPETAETPSLKTEKKTEDTAPKDIAPNDNAPVFVDPAQGGTNPFENAPPTEIDDHPVDEFIGEGDDRPGEGIHF